MPSSRRSRRRELPQRPRWSRTPAHPTVCAVIVAGAGTGPTAAVAGWDTAVVVTASVSLACALFALVIRERTPATITT